MARAQHAVEVCRRNGVPESRYAGSRILFEVGERKTLPVNTESRKSCVSDARVKTGLRDNEKLVNLPLPLRRRWRRRVRHHANLFHPERLFYAMIGSSLIPFPGRGGAKGVEDGAEHAVLGGNRTISLPIKSRNVLIESVLVGTGAVVFITRVFFSLFLFALP